jgi:subtilase family serine protease
MSWGGGEFPQETTFDPVFTTPGVVYFASAGDGPGTIYPCVSPNVVAAGGTSLSMSPFTGNFVGENTWQETGGGPSFFESRPTYQDSISSIVGRQRGVPDIASDANPYTGVWVLDDFAPPPGCVPQCWYTIGGTSVSSPTLAGVVNAAGSFSASSNAELSMLYADKKTDFNDIHLRFVRPLYMGFFATKGWDFCSGLGSPKSYKGK